jgi:hypothetical protein
MEEHAIVMGCPFCGNKDSNQIELSSTNTHVYVVCVECGGRGPDMSFDSWKGEEAKEVQRNRAVDGWNSRYINDSVLMCLKQVKDCSHCKDKNRCRVKEIENKILEKGSLP